ncbi:MAG: hypothetical protein QE487_04245 [Fluviicola sp.]|nr:hypothetical protein [Fluviicola sp.]
MGVIRFIKIILEEPEKAERIILIIIKFLIAFVISILLFQILFPVSNFKLQPSDEIPFISLNKQFPPFQLVTLAVFIVIIWVVLWEIIAKRMVIFIVCFPCFLALIPVFFIIGLLYQVVLNCFKKKNLIQNTANQITDYLISIGIKPNLTIQVFDSISTKDPEFGSIGLLTVINETETTSLIKSRILEYFTILLIVFASNAFVIPWTGWYYLYLIPLFLTCLIGGTIYILRDIDNLVNSDQADLLSDYLEERLLNNQVFEKISQYANNKNHALVKRQNQIELSFCDPNLDEPTRRITICFIILYLNEELSIQSLLSKNETNFIPIFISNQMPDISVINYLNNNKMGFIYADDDVNWIIALEEIEEFAMQIQN